ncbi:hypothetical protein [Streptomyces griseoaurantiacus]|uniref:hypothetical protein n=2 Tax=Streptomyces griseoaurantiacus TaxID=68213 RepID=UPI002867C552|nr:hypothetical protein [Streptomyces griseoaurantiacus]
MSGPAGHSSQDSGTEEQTITIAQRAETAVPASLPLRTIGDLRAALRSGHGFPGDRESFEADMQRALEASSETDLGAVAAVIVDYRGRIRLYQDRDFDTAVQEGIELAVRLKQEDGRQ